MQINLVEWEIFSIFAKEKLRIANKLSNVKQKYKINGSNF